MTIDKFRGKLFRDMSRDELIKAIQYLDARNIELLCDQITGVERVHRFAREFEMGDISENPNR